MAQSLCLPPFSTIWYWTHFWTKVFLPFSTSPFFKSILLREQVRGSHSQAKRPALSQSSYLLDQLRLRKIKASFNFHLFFIWLSSFLYMCTSFWPVLFFFSLIIFFYSSSKDTLVNNEFVQFFAFCEPISPQFVGQFQWIENYRLVCFSFSQHFKSLASVFLPLFLMRSLTTSLSIFLCRFSIFYFPLSSFKILS